MIHKLKIHGSRSVQLVHLLKLLLQVNPWSPQFLFPLLAVREFSESTRPWPQPVGSIEGHTRSCASVCASKKVGTLRREAALQFDEYGLDRYQQKAALEFGVIDQKRRLSRLPGLFARKRFEDSLTA